MAEADAWIAIIDDDPSVLGALRRSLRLHDLQTKTYGSAEEFLAALANGLPECLIVDLQLPGMSGLELLQLLQRKQIQIPAVVISAHGSGNVRERCAAAGAQAFFSKPFQNASLLAAIGAARKKAKGPWP